MSKIQRVLVTGATGYLGGRILETLLKDRNLIIRAGARDLSKLNYLKNTKNLEKVKFDLANESTFEEALKNVDVVINMASMDYQSCVKNEELAYDINVNKMFEFATVAILKKVKTFCFMSTVHVYSTPLEGELVEDRETIPGNVYSLTHRKAESRLIELNEENRDTNFFIFRLANTFGCPVNKNMNKWNLLVNDLCRQAVERKSIKLTSSGLQLRDFVSIDYVLKAIKEVAIYMDIKKQVVPIFNIGSGNSITVLEMAKKIQEVCTDSLEIDVKLSSEPPQSDEVNTAFSLNCKKIQTLIGSEMAHSPSLEILNTLKFCQSLVK